jgi:hypothetical protein
MLSPGFYVTYRCIILVSTFDRVSFLGSQKNSQLVLFLARRLVPVRVPRNLHFLVWHLLWQFRLLESCNFFGKTFTLSSNINFYFEHQSCGVQQPTQAQVILASLQALQLARVWPVLVDKEQNLCKRA